MDQIRPTKKQKQLLDFIEKFILEHGYGPSYREIMWGLDYKSVATVALHIDSLVKRGHLTKKSKSARSIDVVSPQKKLSQIPTTQITPAEEKWLVDKIEYKFHQIENSNDITRGEVDGLYVLVGALRVLELEGASQAFIARLNQLKDRL